MLIGFNIEIFKILFLVSYEIYEYMNIWIYERLRKINNNNIYDFLIYFIYYIILNKCFQININDIINQ